MLLRVILGVLLVGSVLFSERRPDLSVDISADVFSLDAKTNQVIAKGHVVVKQRDVVVKGDLATYDKAAEKVTLTGNIKLTQRLTTMTCLVITVFGAENKVEAKGDVKVTSGDIMGTAGGAIYFLDDDYVVLTDRPKVWTPRDLATGDKVTIDFKNQYIKSTGASRLKLSKRSLQKKGNSVQ